MFKDLSQARELAAGIKENLKDIRSDSIEIIVCPAYTALSEVAKCLSGSQIKLGAQDVYWQEEGAFTGEVSTLMLKDIGCSYVIIGHSERRQYFNETNDGVNKKTKAALKHGLIPIVCVGETLQEREANKIFSVIDDHVKNGLKDIPSCDISKMIIAYEPVWAIGTGKTATPQIAQEVQGYIRNLLIELYGEAIARNIPIQYGGSVKPDNIQELMKQPDIDGALIGGASLRIESFSEIVKKAFEVKK